MPKIQFLPSQTVIDVDPDTKILLAARKGQVSLRYGCASCRCGTCAVAVKPEVSLSEMKVAERELLQRMKLAVDGTVRLSCQAKVSGDVVVDVSFQDTYSPDDGDEF